MSSGPYGPIFVTSKGVIHVLFITIRNIIEGKQLILGTTVTITMEFRIVWKIVPNAKVLKNKVNFCICLKSTCTHSIEMF